MSCEKCHARVQHDCPGDRVIIAELEKRARLYWPIVEKADYSSLGPEVGIHLKFGPTLYAEKIVATSGERLREWARQQGQVLEPASRYFVYSAILPSGQHFHCCEKK